jgi:beta-barrel assembly-enhancing protease
MNKVFFQLLAFIILFFGIWFLLSRIDFTNAIDFKKLSKTNEEKLGKMVIDYLKKTNENIENDSLKDYLNQIKNRVCVYNDIDTGKIQIYIFQNSDVNAFALPGNNIVVYSGMIGYCKKPEELCSVLAHEIAHLENKHIVKKLSKEVGIAVLVTIAGGDAGAEMLKELVRVVSSTAFDRNMEREADATAVKFLSKAHIDPNNLANLMFRLAQKTDVPNKFEWISTHPSSKDRAAEILKLRKNYSFTVKPLLSDSVWIACQEMVK